MLKLIAKGIRTVSDRIRAQGVRTTALWAYARGKPKITGIPPLKYSRVTDSIYVGPQYRANGKRALEHAGITHTVNMRSEFDDRATWFDSWRCPGQTATATCQPLTTIQSQQSTSKGESPSSTAQ